MFDDGLDFLLYHVSLSGLFNCLFIIPVAALIHPITVNWTTMTPALGAGLAATLMLLPLGSWQLGRWRGLVLLAVYVGFIAQSVLAVR